LSSDLVLADPPQARDSPPRWAWYCRQLCDWKIRQVQLDEEIGGTAALGKNLILLLSRLIAVYSCTPRSSCMAAAQPSTQSLALTGCGFWPRSISLHMLWAVQYPLAMASWVCCRSFSVKLPLRLWTVLCRRGRTGCAAVAAGAAR
jgi:hypothetical protein